MKVSIKWDDTARRRWWKPWTWRQRQYPYRLGDHLNFVYAQADSYTVTFTGLEPGKTYNLVDNDDT